MKAPREWTPAIAASRSKSNTGLVGISETMRHGKPRFNVCWYEAKGVKKATTVYFGTNGVPREKALERARDIRFAAVGERLRREERIVP
ncbi:MAG: hypothetical protein P4L99_27960 [Chthoniobacter sp.]|nr:hypothetical protein [Chthoniobacter sp.]